MFARVKHARAELKALEQVVAIDGVPGADLSLDELESRGREHLRLRPQSLAEAKAAVEGEDRSRSSTRRARPGRRRAASSRTATGAPWWTGSFASPGSSSSAAESCSTYRSRTSSPASSSSWRTPRAYDRVLPRSAGLARALGTARPTIVPSVPRVYETIYQSLRAGFEEGRESGGGWSTGRSRWAARRADAYAGVAPEVERGRVEGHGRRLGQPAPPLPLWHRWAVRAGRGGPDRAGRRDPRPGRDRLPRLLRQRGGDPRRPQR